MSTPARRTRSKAKVSDDGESVASVASAPPTPSGRKRQNQVNNLEDTPGRASRARTSTPVDAAPSTASRARTARRPSPIQEESEGGSTSSRQRQTSNASNSSSERSHTRAGRFADDATDSSSNADSDGYDRGGRPLDMLWHSIVYVIYSIYYLITSIPLYLSKMSRKLKTFAIIFILAIWIAGFVDTTIQNAPSQHQQLTSYVISPWNHLKAGVQLTLFHTLASLFGIFKAAKKVEHPYDKPTFDKIARLEHMNEVLHTLLVGYDKKVNAIQRELPRHIAVERSSSGDIEIPPDFWAAMKAKLNHELGVNEDTVAWDNFIARNERHLFHYYNSMSDWAVDKAVNKHDLITAERFLEVVEDTRDSLRKEMDEVRAHSELTLKKLFQELRGLTYEAAQVVLQQKFANLPIAEFDKFVTAGLLHQANIAVRTVNYFSERMGAFVNPIVTSPRYESKDLGRYWRRSPKEEPPIVALQPWREEGECFCVAAPPPVASGAPEPGSEGVQPHLQLGVTMPVPVFPTAITVEHVPQSGSRIVGTAPRDMELWLSIMDPEIRARMQRYSDETYSHLRAFSEAGSRRVFNFGSSWISRGIQARTGTGPLDDSWVLVHSFQYDAADPVNHVQTFPLAVDLRNFAASGVTNAVVRATSNHGGRRTCLYQVRLHGWEEAAWHGELKVRSADGAWRDVWGLRTAWNGWPVD